MTSAQAAEEHAVVSVENVGGIDEAEVSFAPGITVLAGRNATNRTSFLQAIMAGLGSDNVSIKGDADEARVEVTLGEETFTRTLERAPDGVLGGGDPYLDDATEADLFAFLLETNEARNAVALGGDLRELIMRPIDTDAIQAQITQLETERRRIADELEELEELADRVPGLEEQIEELDDEIEEAREALAEKEAEIEDADADVEETREEKADLEEQLAALRDARSAIEDIRRDIDAEQRSIEALEEELEELEAEADELPDAVGDGDDIDAELVRLRERVQALNSTVSELQTIIQFNEDMLEGTSSEVAGALRGDDGAVTDRLVEDEVVCWTCGSEVERSQIEATLGRLRELRREKLSTRNDVQDEIEELESERDSLERQRRRREEVADRIERTERELERRRETVEDLKERREDRQEAVEALEGSVEELRSEDQSAVLDLHKEANRLEFELGRLEQRRDRAADELADVEDRLGERDDLETRRESITDELDDLRTKVERIERDAVEQFNDHMDAILDVLDYENLERVWIEHVEREGRSGGRGRGSTTERTFDLHIVRSTDDGAVYEDTVEHLSESEREVVGLVFALAGYLAHDVYEDVPFVLLDSLEAIDSERIARLVDYLGDYADYLVVALLEEDAAALDDSYERITQI